MKRFWVGWNEPVDDSQDSRPRKWPLPPSICAVVDAMHAREAADIIEGAGWSKIELWRFCEEKPADWMPSPDRFPPRSG